MKEKEDTSTSRTTVIITTRSSHSSLTGSDLLSQPQTPRFSFGLSCVAIELNCSSVSIPNRGGRGGGYRTAVRWGFMGYLEPHARPGPGNSRGGTPRRPRHATSRADAVASGVARRARRAPPSDAIARSARNRFQILGVRLWPTGGVGSGPCLKIERRPVRGATAFDGGTRVSAGGGRAAVRARRRGR